MRIDSLAVRDFRNLASVALQPDPRFNVFVGDNGQGKTNLLESIYVLSALKSFRSFRNRDLIRRDAQHATIEARIDRSGSWRDARVTIRPGGRRVEINDKTVSNLADFFGTFNALVFSPDDIGVLRGSPADRRLFFDRMVFHAVPAFAAESAAYETALRSRNVVLRQERVDRALVAAYDAQLARYGAAILVRRRALLERLAEPLQDAFGEIFGPGLDPRVCYDGEGSGLVDAMLEADAPTLEAQLLARLEQSLRGDAERGHTSVGPHRDDFVATLQGEPVRVWASQGQHRAFALALKITEIRLLRELLEQEPVLLLDDVSSELDARRNAQLFDFLSNTGGQVFITTTDVAHVRLRGPFSRWRIHDGQLGND